MISKTKILSIIIVLSMIMTGLTLVSWNVVAEDSNQPFLASGGYPMITDLVDQEQRIYNNFWTITDQNQAAQIFRCDVTSQLSNVQIWTSTLTGGGYVYVDIQDASGSLPGTILGSTSIRITSLAEGDWSDIPFTVKPS